MDITYTQYGDHAALEAKGTSEEIAPIVAALNQSPVAINITSAGGDLDNIASKIADVLRKEARGMQGSCDP